MSTSSLPWILGISASHNGAVCLLHGDEIVASVQEERLTRVKRARIQGAHGSLALQYCLDAGGIRVEDLSHVGYCAQKPVFKPDDDIFLNPVLQLTTRGISSSTIGHHLGHAFGAFGTSGVTEAAVLVVDGMGSGGQELSDDEKATVVGGDLDGGETVSIYFARGVEVKPIEKHLVKRRRWIGSERDLAPGAVFGAHGMPHFGSLGGLYGAAATQIFGDPMNGAGKVMGLAPYGKAGIPISDFFDIVDGRFVFHDTVPKRFLHANRWPHHEADYLDLAASAQRALEEALLYLARRAREKTQCDTLCYAGGVALNSVANERIIREAGFKDVFIMPAAEDSGTAIGAAYYGLWKSTGKNTHRKLVHDAVGRQYSDQEVSAAIEQTPCIEVVRPADIVKATVEQLIAGKIVGWFDGRSELGPRSLGQRSILCDARSAHFKDILNSRVKHREGFRPFAPLVPLEEANDWFELDGVSPESPYMLRIAKFRESKRALVPSVVHVDGTGRIQTVTREANGRLYDVLKEFHRQTGIPIIINTSFNVAGEPIVETPLDALWCLLYTGVDCCVMGDRVVTKHESYHSVLQLYLRLATPRVTVHWDTRHGALAAVGAGEIEADDPDEDAPGRHGSSLSFEVDTRWGKTTYVTEAAVLPFLQRANGTMTGQQILKAMQSDGSSLDERQMIRLIGRLRRMSLISVHMHPTPGAAQPAL